MVELSKATAFDYVRFVFSVCLLSFSLVITSYSIFHGKTGFWDSVPGWTAYALFVIDLILLGIVEGLQIALVELKRQHPDSYKLSHPRAYSLGQIASKKDNVERFLMGRQVFVVFLVFFIAKLTTVKLDDLNDFIFPVPKWFYVSLLETGFLTCILVVIVAQLMPQIVASKYPVHFLNFWLMKPAYYACVTVETTGITHACWLLSHLMGYISGMKSEDVVFQTVAKQKTSLLTQGRDPETGLSENKLTPNDGYTSDRKILSELTAYEALQDVEDILDDVEDKHCPLEGQELIEYSQHDSYSGKFKNLVQAIDMEVDPDIRKILQFYLSNHPEKFRSFPSVVGNKVYPPPQLLAEEFRSAGAEVPGFLRDISDPNHVPPHIVACKLLVQVMQLEQKMKRDSP